STYADPSDDSNMEICLVTSRSTDSFTMTRGQLGTSAVAHAGTPRIALLVVDQHFKDIHTAINAVENVTLDTIAEGSTNKYFTSTEKTKLSNIESNADVTDTANVTAAGALMDSEVDADIKTLSLPASTTISTAGAELINDASAADQLVTLGLSATASE